MHSDLGDGLWPVGGGPIGLGGPRRGGRSRAVFRTQPQNQDGADQHEEDRREPHRAEDGLQPPTWPGVAVLPPRADDLPPGERCAAECHCDESPTQASPDPQAPCGHRGRNAYRDGRPRGMPMHRLEDRPRIAGRHLRRWLQEPRVPPGGCDAHAYQAQRDEATEVTAPRMRLRTLHALSPKNQAEARCDEDDHEVRDRLQTRREHDVDEQVRGDQECSSTQQCDCDHEEWRNKERARDVGSRAAARNDRPSDPVRDSDAERGRSLSSPQVCELTRRRFVLVEKALHLHTRAHGGSRIDAIGTARWRGGGSPGSSG